MTDATRIHRAILVKHTEVATWDEFIRAGSRADDGRDPTENQEHSAEDTAERQRTEMNS